MSTLNNLITNFWENLWIEWIILHILLVYCIYKIWIEQNLLKLVILCIYFLLIICIYISLLQLELFACFLFVSEFIIFVFFYALFLNIQLSVKYNNSFKNILLNYSFYLLLLFVIIFFLFIFKTNIVINYNELYLNFYNVYKIYNNNIVNDLVFFYNIMFHYNLIIYLLIALILLIMTFILIYFVVTYHFLIFFKDYTYYLNLDNLNLKDVPLSIVNNKQLHYFYKYKI